MTISNDLKAKILRYHYVEKWRVGTISRLLGPHHTTIKRILTENGAAYAETMPGPSAIEPYLPFMLETLRKYPKLTASRLYTMVCERGYSGGPDHFRHLVALHRPRPAAEAYLRLKTLPGEQAQVDWGHFGYIEIGKAKRPLMAFVMVLSYSRKIFLRFYLNQQMANFLRGHDAAFNAFGGVPKVLLYDNLKSAVLERLGDAIRFHPTLLGMAGHYRFEPRPVAVARGNEKGRVERAIRYIRDNFFAARKWQDLDDLNEQAMHWCNRQAADRPCPEDLSQSVGAVYEQERQHLLALPDNPFPVDEKEEVHVGKTPYVRFDLNDYSVPHTYVRRTLTVFATLKEVSIVDGAEMIAKHQRCYDKAKQIECNSHIQALVAQKRQARQHSGHHRLINHAPNTAQLLKQAATRGHSIKPIIRGLLQLLDDYGASEFEIAIDEALTRQVPHPNAVRLCLEKRREERQLPPPIRFELPNDKRVQAQIVRQHSLEIYNVLQKGDDNDE